MTKRKQSWHTSSGVGRTSEPPVQSVVRRDSGRRALRSFFPGGSWGRFRRAGLLATTFALQAALVMLVIGCERSRKAEISGEAARGIEKSVPELAAVVLSNPSFSMSPDHEVARVDGSPLLSSDLRVFIDRARANGYRPASLSEARRLLRAALQEKALALDAERRGHSPSDPVGLEATYQELTVELTGSVPLGGSDDGGSRDFRAEDQQIERIHAQHRGRIQRVAILEALLDRSRVEVDLAQLARFVDEPGPSGSPPRPPITAARDDETSS